MTKLTDLDLKRASKPGLLADGAGLFLSVTPRREGGFAKSWLVRFTAPDRRRREMGLGAYPEVGLGAARLKARSVRDQARNGVDPLAERERQRKDAAAAAARSITFREFARRWIEAQIAADAELDRRAPGSATWGNPKHRKQWLSTLETYVFPIFGDVAVGEVDRAMVLDALRPIWASRHETARRVCQRIRAILAAAEEEGRRSPPNAADWTAIKRAMPAIRRVVKNHAALPFDEIGSFMAALREQAGSAARALEFAILTAARTGEVLGARWSEIDLEKRVWIVPAPRMKAGREHRVPLSPQAIALLSRQDASVPDDGAAFVFFGASGASKPLSNMAMLALLRRMARADLTVHGFRSTFRDWAAERTNFAREIAEAALAHAVSDHVEAAYRRGDLFEKRRRLMNAWGANCDTQAAKGDNEVVQLRANGDRT